jgi:hypothetical protein
MMFDLESHSLDEQAAASVVAMLGTKRGREESADAADVAGGGEPECNRAKIARVDTAPTSTVPAVARQAVSNAPTLQPAPYFYYKDYSEVPDPDPLSPLTPPGRVPNFPAKMHAILSRPDLVDIVSWMDHGRSWRVLKPREFEVRVIPTYFEHSKFSSFIRQANGWGFRRITQGRDRNSYYHPLFLRGLPHLCKQMKRPGVSEKVAVDVDHEPDFYKISAISPVPEKADDDSIMLHCTVNGGPKARMPVYCGGANTTGAVTANATVPATTTTSIQEQAFLASFQQALASADKQQQANPALLMQNAFAASNAFAAQAPAPAAATGLQFASIAPATQQQQPNAAAQAAASQFAAGFAAATALSSSHLRNVFEQALATSPQFQPLQPQPQVALPDQPQNSS